MRRRGYFPGSIMHHAMAELPEWASYFHLAAVALLLLVLDTARAVYRVLATPDARATRARRVALATTGRLLAVGGIWIAIVYGHGAWERAGAHNCRHLPAVDASARYAAEYCYLRQDRLLLRIYDARRDGVLARRTFTSVEPVRLSWDGQALVYDAAAPGAKGRLLLPPTMRDKLLARLP